MQPQTHSLKGFVHKLHRFNRFKVFAFALSVFIREICGCYNYVAMVVKNYLARVECFARQKRTSIVELLVLFSIVFIHA